MARKILLDTNILISAFRKNEKVVKFLDNKSLNVKDFEYIRELELI